MNKEIMQTLANFSQISISAVRSKQKAEFVFHNYNTSTDFRIKTATMKVILEKQDLWQDYNATQI